MKQIPNTNAYFFQHCSKDGYVIGIQKNITGGYSVVIYDEEEELLNIRARKQEDIEFIYETLYQWLAFLPSDVIKRCKKLGEAEDLSIAIQLLPLAEVSITVPNLKQLEFVEFKKKMKKS